MTIQKLWNKLKTLWNGQNEKPEQKLKSLPPKSPQKNLLPKREPLPKKDPEWTLSKQGHRVAVVPFLDGKSLYTWIYEEQHRNVDVVYRYVLNNIKLAIKNNWDTVEIFRLGPSGAYAKLDQKDFATVTEKMQKYFIRNEQYELANTCKQILEKYSNKN